jgi:hypothetical protein
MSHGIDAIRLDFLIPATVTAEEAGILINMCNPTVRVSQADSTCLPFDFLTDDFLFSAFMAHLIPLL